MLDVNKRIGKLTGYEGKVDIKKLEDFIKKSFTDARADMLIEYIKGRDVKKLSKEYHLASSRITNLFDLTLQRFYTEVLK